MGQLIKGEMISGEAVGEETAMVWGMLGGEEKEFQQRYHEGDQDRVYHAHGERGHLDP